MSKGIDYGMGQTNIDKANGIRYGVIPMHDLSEFAYESFEADYGAATCPKCGNDAQHGAPCEDLSEEEEGMITSAKANLGFEADTDHDICEDGSVYCGLTMILEKGSIARWEFARGACGDYHCEDCHYAFDGEHAFGDEPIGHYLDDGEYLAQLDSYNDIFILKSPYFTRAQFCSPCAPGACHLSNPCEDGEKAYCFGHDWFEDGKAPYLVYSVATGELVNPK